MEDKSGIRIASFNIQKFSTISVMTKSNGETKKDLDTIGRIIRENQFDIIAIQEIYHKEALKELLEKLAMQYVVEERMRHGSKSVGNPHSAGKTSESFGYRTKHWEGRWASPNSYYGDNEGYAFIWNRDRVKLVTNMKNEAFEPRIEEYISKKDSGNLVRPPFLGRFMPINGRYEIRLINTHAVEGLDENPLACAFVRARGTDRMCSFGDWVALSDICDGLTASLIAPEVSDGVIAPGYTEEALAILKAKRKGNYNVVAIDPDYIPKSQECKEIYGIAFHQDRNNFKIGEHLLANIVTENKDLPESAKIDLIVALITLKYTQSNSVCFAYDGQAIGVGAGQQSRIHCTRLAGSKADTWFLRQHPKTLALPFRADLGRANRDNVIDGYINGNEEDVCADGIWRNYFTEQPDRLTEGDKKAWLASRRDVALGSDAFFPFGDNIKRAFASGVKYIAEPGGSIRDDPVIEECNKKDMVMVFTGMRLFHH